MYIISKGMEYMYNKAQITLWLDAPYWEGQKLVYRHQLSACMGVHENVFVTEILRKILHIYTTPP